MEKLTLSVQEAAEQLGVGMNTMYNLVHRADFPKFRPTERIIRIPVDGLKAWIENEQSGGKA